MSLPLEQTTPITEAVENGVADAIRSLDGFGHHLQHAIAAATSAHPDPSALVVKLSRLGRSWARGWASAWATAVDGLALIAADVTEWWWTGQLSPPWTPGSSGAADGEILGATALRLPEGTPIDAVWVRVVDADDTSSFLDRAPGVPPGWKNKCYVAVRQHGEFIPNAVALTFSRSDSAGTVVAESDPIEAVLTLPAPP